jgi:hypothetical protein
VETWITRRLPSVTGRNDTWELGTAWGSLCTGGGAAAGTQNNPPDPRSRIPRNRPVIHTRLLARIFFVSSCTCRYVLPRAGIRASIFLMPCSAVV